MWFYIPAGILIVALVWWVLHTNLYRQRRRRRGIDPGQQGTSRSTGFWGGGSGPGF
jgi:hypothetical protein